jgi:ATPase subunit of ABC transporter with duplicated ATPase domains
MKILGGDLDPSGGQVMLEPNVRLGKLRQDQFAYEEFTVIDTVIMGHEELWKVKAERDRIYSLPEMSEEDGMAVAELETEFAEMDGYTAESRAGELLLGLGIPLEQHFGPMSEVAPGWKLRVLLAQALFSDPEVLLLDEPTNHLDINTIRWLENILTQRNSTMIIISHDRHFLNSVCTHMADLDYGELRLFPGNYDEYMTAATQSREQLLSDNAKKKARSPNCNRSSAASRPTPRKPSRPLPAPSDRQDPAGRGQAFEPREPVHPFRTDQKAAPPGGDRRKDGQRLRRQAAVQGLQLPGRSRRARGDHRPERYRQDHPAAHLVNELTPDAGSVKWTDARSWATTPRTTPTTSKTT